MLLLVAINRLGGDGRAIVVGVAEHARRAAEADAEARTTEIARFTELVRRGASRGVVGLGVSLGVSCRL